MELGAPAVPRLVLQPREQPVGEAAAAGALGGHEVVDVHVLPPREVLVDTEAGHGGGLLGAVLEGADQPVAGGPLALGGLAGGGPPAPRGGAGGPLALVDLAGEGLRAPVVRAQLEQRTGGEVGLAGAELADGHARNASAA